MQERPSHISEPVELSVKQRGVADEAQELVPLKHGGDGIGGGDGGVTDGRSTEAAVVVLGGGGFGWRSR